MKIIQNKQMNALPRSDLSKKIENKQNQPTNALQKLKRHANKSQNVKIGKEIKQKIQRMFEEGTKHQQRQPLGEVHMRTDFQIHSQRFKLSLTKSVSFNERSQSPMPLRHNSKKSILKNSQISLNSSFSLKQSQISLMNSHVGAQDQSIEFQVGNKTIKDKYQKIMISLTQSNKKYTDEVYPPVKSSIYLNNSLMKNFCLMLEKEGRQIQWMRISELYSHKKLTVWNTQKDKKSYILNGPMSITSDYLPGAFNLIRNKNCILQRMFESQQVNKQGIYFIKMHQTQQNIWKYIIIDDYIPVIVNKKIALTERYLPENVYSAFLNVQSYSDTLQIWPFLLQKAYAKYYSTYDSLANGYIYDFIQEITGTFFQQQKIKDNHDKVNKIIKNQDALIIGEDKNGIFYPIKNIHFEDSCNSYTFLDKQNYFIQKTLTFEEFTTKFHTIHFSYLHKYYYTSKCQVQQENVKNNKNHEGYLLRSIQIDQNCQCQIGIIQKQQRLYRSLLSYEYAWMRVILVQKESSGYRWVSATYSNHKTIKIVAALSPGNYILIIIPQWNEKKFDFNLIYKGTINAAFERPTYDLNQNIIQDSCMDLAQRFGRLAQINKNICSYHYIERAIGFVIENVNNQKESGHVRILRSIEGLQKFNIKPINPQFKIEHTIQVVIPNLKSFTVVLMTTKGVKPSILDMFDFGS